MPVSQRFRIQALLCAVLLIVCVLVAHPFAETGMTDDWSYIRTAQVLAQTGHIVFNGWGAPLLGWQLLPGALCIQLFGFSFTTVRMSTLFAAVPATFLVQRSMVRSGIKEWNATIATLTIMLSPLMLPAVTSFLSDIWGFFAIVLCLYCCLRALQASTDGAAIGWICGAALGNAVTGTARQIAWLGVLVMVPCALWLLRRRRRVLVAGVVACAAGDMIVYAAMAWFARQPYSVPESLHLMGRRNLLFHPSYYLRGFFEVPMLLLPVLLMFLPAVRQASRRAQAVFGAVCVVLAGIAVELHRHKVLHNWLVPFVTERGSIFSKNGSYVIWPISGAKPLAIPEAVRLGLTAIVLLGVMAWLLSFTGRRGCVEPEADTRAPISWRSLLVLVVPFTLAYIGLVMPRAIRNLLIDRYMIPLVVIAALVLVRYYQERMRPRLPVWSLVLALAIAAYSVAAVHDSFAMYRGVLRAANELRAAGVPRDRIDAGWEYNGWTQITEGGYVHQYGVRVPGGINIVKPAVGRVCAVVSGVWLPRVRPDYALSLDPADCGGEANFPPVAYKRWLAPHTMTIYVVHDPPGDSPEPDYDNLP